MKKSVTTFGWTVIAMIAISSLKPLIMSGAEAKLTNDFVSTNSAFLTEESFEIEKLKQQLEQKDKALKALEKLLFTANANAETSQRELEASKKRDAALGIEVLTADEKELQQRLITALSSLYHSEQEREKAFTALAKLIEETEKTLKQVKLSAEERKKIEAQLQAAKSVIDEREAHKQSALNASLLNAEVIGYEPKLNLVVLNVGWLHEVKTGMVFEIGARTEIKALCRVVDIRKRVSGALVENFLKKDELVVGDPARVKLVRTPKLEK